MAAEQIQRVIHYGDEDCDLAVWETARKVKGKDPALFRYDTYGTIVSWENHEYDLTGWNIDHMIEHQNGGGDQLANLQVLSSIRNIEMVGKKDKKRRDAKENKRQPTKQEIADEREYMEKQYKKHINKQKRDAKLAAKQAAEQAIEQADKQAAEDAAELRRAKRLEKQNKKLMAAAAKS